MKMSQSHDKIRQRILDNARLLIDDESNHVNGGFMKRFCQIVLSIVILGFSASAVFACRSNDMGAPNKGHHHYGKSSEILQQGVFSQLNLAMNMHCARLFGILSTGESNASSVFLSSAAGFTLPSGSRKKEGGFEFHCAINQPLESGTDNEAGAASKDALRGSEFQLTPMGDLSNWVFSLMQMSSTRPTEK